jgi:hypothetical protein
MDRTGNADNPTPPARRRDATSAAAQHLDVATLSSYVDRTLSASDQRAVEAHLASCPSCRQELAETSATVDLLRGLPNYQPRRSFRIDSAVARRERGSIVWLGPYLSALPALRVATAAVTLLFLGTIAADVLTNSNVTSDTEFAADEVVTTRSTEDDAFIAVATVTPPHTSEPDMESAGGPEGAMEAALEEEADDEPQSADQEEDTAAGAAVSDETRSEGAAGETALREAPAPAQSAPTVTADPTPIPMPTETAVPTPTQAPISERPSSAFGERFPWLLAEILLGVLLILLATALFMLRRLRRRLGGTR